MLKKNKKTSVTSNQTPATSAFGSFQERHHKSERLDLPGLLCVAVRAWRGPPSRDDRGVLQRPVDGSQHLCFGPSRMRAEEVTPDDAEVNSRQEGEGGRRLDFCVS